MIIKRTSIIDGVERDMDLPVTQEQLDQYENGQGHVQDIFPRLRPGFAIIVQWKYATLMPCRFRKVGIQVS